MKKPTTLDSSAITSLNTVIACHGADLAEQTYRQNCKRVSREPEAWAINYFRLYLKYHKNADSYIDVQAAQRALDES